MTNSIFNATIIGRLEVSSKVIVFRIKPDFNIPDFEAGQYMAVGVCGCEGDDNSACIAGRCHESEEEQKKSLIKRTYSAATPSFNKEYLEFCIGLVPGGKFTSRVWKLREGSRVFAMPKLVGSCTLREVPPEAALVMIATGTGISPFISMLRSESVWLPQRPVTLIQGARYRKELAYREDLLAFAAAHKNFLYFPSASREETEDVPRGYVQDFINSGKVDLDGKNVHVFLCGNPNMVEEMQELLEGRGFKVHSKDSPGNIHTEKHF